MKVPVIFFTALVIATSLYSCRQPAVTHVRPPVDTIGFAQYSWQMDSILARIAPDDRPEINEEYKAVICPHDDYAYAAGLYSRTLAGIKAPLVIMVGVAHKAKHFNLENQLIFGSFDAWKAPGGQVRVSPLRDSLLSMLSRGTYVVHDSMMIVEHSLEAIVPFLQQENRKVEIVPLLVPYMRFERMNGYAAETAACIYSYMQRHKLVLGRDVAIVISNDALHYGDEDWGGADLAPFGCDSAGNARANQKDLELIATTLEGELSIDRVRDFFNTTVKEDDYRAYNWTWCGRYSVPFGLLLASHLNRLENNPPLTGTVTGYRSSILNPHIRVDDLGMGTTAPANMHHWVSYVGVVYR